MEPPALEPLRLSRNESPYGLTPSATQAVRGAIDSSSYRYPIDEPRALEEAIAKRFGVEKENVILGCGSIEILRMATETFCNSSRPAVVAEPTFEAVVSTCPFVHARSIKINLTSDYKHDLTRMLRASHNAGMIFFGPIDPAGTMNPNRVDAFVQAPARRSSESTSVPEYIDRGL